MKQNIKLRENLKGLDENLNIETALDKIELEYYKRENNKLKYYIRNYSTLSKDLYKLQQIDNLIHVNKQKDLMLSNELDPNNFEKSKLVKHIELCNKLLVYNYFDSCNLSHKDTREFIMEMNELIWDKDYIPSDNIVYNNLMDRINTLETELEYYKTDEKLFMYHVEKISYNILNEIAKKNKKENLSVPFTCLSVAINELNQIKNKLDKKNIDIDGLDRLFIQIRNCMEGYDKGFLNKDTEKNLKLLKKYIGETKKYKEKCVLYEKELGNFQKIKKEKIKENDTDDLIACIYKIVNSKKYDEKYNEKTENIIDIFHNKHNVGYNDQNIVALKHYIYYLINNLILKSKNI